VAATGPNWPAPGPGQVYLHEERRNWQAGGAGGACPREARANAGGQCGGWEEALAQDHGPHPGPSGAAGGSRPGRKTNPTVKAASRRLALPPAAAQSKTLGSGGHRRRQPNSRETASACWISPLAHSLKLTGKDLTGHKLLAALESSDVYQDLLTAGQVLKERPSGHDHHQRAAGEEGSLGGLPVGDAPWFGDCSAGFPDTGLKPTRRPMDRCTGDLVRSAPRDV